MSLSAVRRYRALRGIVRVISLAAGPARRSVTERLLRATFGDTVEAQGHLLRVDPGDRPLGERLRRRGVWSEAETALYEKVVRAGDSVIDCGAHIGYFTTIFARRVGPTGAVLAFEPEHRNRRLLEENIARNGYGNVTVIGSALSRESGRAMLSLATGNLGDHRLGRELPGRRSVAVTTTTLDAQLAEGARRPDFIKLDVQGSEPAVFDGAQAMLQACTDVSILTEFWPSAIHEAGDDPYEFLERIADSGFTTTVLEPSGGLTPVTTQTDRRRLAGNDATDANLFCWKGRSPLDRG